MPDEFKPDKWIPETRRIVMPWELPYCTIKDMGVFQGRFRFLFTNDRFVELVTDNRTKSGLNIYRPLEKWRYHVKDYWRLKHKTESELLILRNTAVKYLEIAKGDRKSFAALNWLQHKAGLEPHLYLTMRQFVIEVDDIRELLKIPKQ